MIDLFVMVVSWYLLSPSLILLATVYSRGTRYPPHVSFVTTPQGGLSQEHACCMRSQSHERSWPHLLKLKFGNGWLISKCCCTSCQKIQFWFSIPIPIPIPGFSILIPIPFLIPPISIPIPIPELELELTWNSNSGIELTPTLSLSGRALHLALVVFMVIIDRQCQSGLPFLRYTDKAI